MTFDGRPHFLKLGIVILSSTHLAKTLEFLTAPFVCYISFLPSILLVQGIIQLTSHLTNCVDYLAAYRYRFAKSRDTETNISILERVNEQSLAILKTLHTTYLSTTYIFTLQNSLRDLD